MNEENCQFSLLQITMCPNVSALPFNKGLKVNQSVSLAVPYSRSRRCAPATCLRRGNNCEISDHLRLSTKTGWSGEKQYERKCWLAAIVVVAQTRPLYERSPSTRWESCPEFLLPCVFSAETPLKPYLLGYLRCWSIWGRATWP